MKTQLPVRLSVVALFMALLNTWLFCSSVHAQPLINVDFGGTNSTKTGYAAIGRTEVDFWNACGYLGTSSNNLARLSFANGTASWVGLDVTGQHGDSTNGHADAMFNPFLFRGDGGNMQLSITNLPPGTYDLLLYGHGPADADNGFYEVAVGGTSYGVQGTTNTAEWTTNEWLEGYQYVAFRSVTIATGGQAIAVTVWPGQNTNLALISGLQLVFTGDLSVDSDGDGMPDGWEIQYGLNPLVNDAGGDLDGDGLTNLQEYQAGTNPLSTDTDGDGMPDEWEVRRGLNPLLDDSQNDPDGDGLTNLQEYQLGTDPWVDSSTHGRPLLNVDFGGGTNSTKSGFAALGQTLTDFWNGCAYLGVSSNHLTRLSFANGKAGWVGLNATGLAGNSTNGHADAMFNPLLFREDGGNIQLTLTNLPPGTYDLLLYGHGPADTQNGFYDVAVGETSYAGQSTTNTGQWASREWQEGVQYVAFRGVSITTTGQNLTVTVWPGQTTNLALISGLQLVFTGDLTVDTDGDGLPDYEELEVGTDPNRSDTDGDGIPDSWEVRQGLNPLVNDAASDADGDGLSNLQEFQLGTDPLNPDTDGDGISDYDEVTTFNTNPLNPDTDGDGLRDDWEIGLGTNPLNPDTDGDGLLDGLEVLIYGTNPLSADSDSDGMPDGWEVSHGLNPASDDSAQDADGDGLTNLQEYQTGTDPQNPDTDGDGLSDGAEVNTHGTNPLNSDSDGDGMPDGWEVQYSLNPLVNDAQGDADNDGVTNLQEYQLGTNPTQTDTDGDGLTDGQELQLGTDPTKVDTDGDGLGDGVEVILGTNPTNTDTDGDGLDDGQEILAGTNPLNTDSDGDGLPDGWEVRHGLDPQKDNGDYKLINPVRITKQDSAGRITDSIQATRSTVNGRLRPSNAFPQSSWVRWSQNSYDDASKLVHSRVYFDIPSSGSGSSGTNYNQTDYGYDDMDRRNRVKTPGGTITRTVFHPKGWPLENWVGTDDTGATDINPAGSGAPNNMVLVQANEYDNGAAGGDGNLTQVTAYVNATDVRVTIFGYDFRNRQLTVNGEVDFYEVRRYDNQDRITKMDRRNTNGAGPLVSRQMTKFDNRGQVYQTYRYGVDPQTGVVTQGLVNNNWYDPSGNLLKQLNAGGRLFNKLMYDGMGRMIRRYAAYDVDETAYADAGGVDDDTVMEQVENTYDPAGNLIQIIIKERFHDAVGQGPLMSPNGEQPKARVSFTANYPDPLGRVVAAANYGTNGANAFSRPATIPARSNTVLVDSTSYNSCGDAWKTVDPQATERRLEFDDARRNTQIVENYVSGGTANDQNRTTELSYNADGKLETLMVKNADTGDQVTTWEYGTTLSDSDVASNELLSAQEYPDGSSDRVEYTYNRVGEMKQIIDQRGSVRTLDYDKLGRLLHDRVTTLGTGVDDAVRRISRAYEVRGMVVNVTSYDNATVGSGSVVNEVKSEYNDFAQLAVEYQSHSGAVDTDTTPKLQYAYADGGKNRIRRVAMTYPDGRVTAYDYGSAGSMNDVLSRVRGLKDGSTVMARYTYLGLGEIVRVEYGESMELTYVRRAGEPVGDAGDQYTGLDRFGRVVDQRWIKTNGTALERVDYGYTRAGNRQWRQNRVATGGQDEYYGYDGLYQVKQLDRGTLNSGMTGISGTPTWEEDFTYDPIGNWNAYLTKVSGVTDLDQNRTHNQANELTEIDGSASTVANDSAGNMVTVPQVDDWDATFNLVWDAWNRLMEVKDGTDSVAVHAYDGLTRRVTKLASTTLHYYYSDQWQILEVRLADGTEADRQFVWGQRYMDDLVLRDRDVDHDGSLDERLFVLHDYFNPTAIANSSGEVLERYSYHAFGSPLIMAPNFTSRADSPYDWETLFKCYYFDSETGLYNARYRYLHCELGRWVCRDPITSAAFTILSPSSGLHSKLFGESAYAFSGNKPTSETDPYGLLTLSQFKKQCEMDGPRKCDGLGKVFVSAKVILADQGITPQPGVYVFWKQYYCEIKCGDCTPAEKDRRQAVVNVACKDKDLNHKCFDSEPCAKLYRTLKITCQCKDARKSVLNCYAGGDPGHQQAYDNSLVPWMDCAEIFNRKKCWREIPHNK